MVTIILVCVVCLSLDTLGRRFPILARLDDDAAFGDQPAAAHDADPIDQTRELRRAQQ